MEVVDGIGERPAADRLCAVCAAEGTPIKWQVLLGNSPDVRTERVGSKECYRRGRRFLTCEDGLFPETRALHGIVRLRQPAAICVFSDAHIEQSYAI